MNSAGRFRRTFPLYNEQHERDGLRAASRFNAELLDYVRPYVQPGITTLQIDEMIHQYTLDH